MTSFLFGIAVSALLSCTSLLVVLFRVSPLSSPEQAIPAFFCSLFLAVSSVSTLLFFTLWRHIPHLTWDLGRTIASSVRQGVMLGLATSIVAAFLMLGILSWWNFLLIYAVFVLTEVALNS